MAQVLAEVYTGHSVMVGLLLWAQPPCHCPSAVCLGILRVQGRRLGQMVHLADVWLGKLLCGHDED